MTRRPRQWRVRLVVGVYVWLACLFVAGVGIEIAELVQWLERTCP